MGTETRIYNAADFERLPEGPPCQLIDGELIMTPSPSYGHQAIVLKIASKLLDFVQRKRLGHVVAAPLDVYLTDLDVYQPDVIYVSNQRKHIIKERIKGAPDLLVEVLSPSNAYYDLGHKKNVYESAGIREYWIVDVQEKSVEVYVNRDNRFTLIDKKRVEGIVRSETLEGFSIELVSLFKE